MAKRGHSEERIPRALRQAESGSRVADICREYGISEAAYYIYSGLGLNELRELRQLREENGKLKRLATDLSLDRHILQEIVKKGCKASPSMAAGAVDADGVRAQHAAGVGADDDQSVNDEPPEPKRSAARAAGEAARIGGARGAFRLPMADRNAQA